MTKTPNQSAFTAANEILERFEHTIDLFKFHIVHMTQDPKWANYEVKIANPWGDSSPLDQNICVFIDDKTPQPASLNTRPKKPLERLHSMTPRGKTQQVALTGGWAHVEFAVNGQIRILTGKSGDSFLKMDNATTLEAGSYQSPDVTVAQILLIMAQRDFTPNYVFKNMVLNAIGRNQDPSLDNDQ